MNRQVAWDMLGWLGAVLLLLAYTLSSMSILAQGAFYHSLNLIGALGVGKAAWTRKSHPAAFVEFAWAAIAMIALLRLLWLAV